jgi:hypothetical protein
MRVDQCVGCNNFPCEDVYHELYIIPDIDIKPEQVSIVMISEAAPLDRKDYYYAGGDTHYKSTTVQAFNDSGANVSSIGDILDMGVYLTTAVKCGKKDYGIKAGTIKECSLILERELDLFPQAKVFLLMGDVAIKGVNYISKREGAGKAIPAGSTYKIRGGEYYFRGARAFPSYMQVGPSYGIEKSKQRMIAEDIAAALRLLD